MMGEYFLVTGGSGGIGREVCKCLFSMGYHPVIGFCSNEKAANEIALECDGVALKLDLRNTSSIGASLDQLILDGIDLKGVVLAASPPPMIIPFGQIQADDIAKQLQVHVIGNQYLLKILIKSFFSKDKNGVIIGVLSDAMGNDVKASMNCMGSYIVGKFGLLGLLSVISCEYKWLKVETIKPEFTETRMLDVFDERFVSKLRDGNRLKAPDVIARDICSLIDA